IDLRAGVARGEDFDGQVGSARKELARGSGESKSAQAFFRKEGNIRRATVAVVHPTTQVGAKHSAQTVLPIEGLKRKKQAGENTLVLKVVLGAHNQFTVDYFVDVSVIRQRLKFRLRPDLGWVFGRNAHGGNLPNPLWPVN